MIASGKRNFALDLSPLDYIYSDTINALMALNRSTLDVSGRLSLLGPQPEVLQILKRAGIHNILRIFDDEADLIRTSEEIILQTSSFRLGDLKNLAQQEPQSEFDQLRSEIGSAFGGAPTHMQEEPLPPPPKTKSISSYMPSQPPAVSPVASSFEQEFDEAFNQFASEDNNMDYAAPPSQYNIPQSANYIPPPPPTRTVFNPAAAQFQNRQFMPQPPVSPVPPPRPAAPQAPVFDSAQMPMPGHQPSDFSSVRNDRFQPPASTRAAQPLEDDFDEEITGRGRTSKIKVQDDSFDESDDDFFEEARKKSPVPMIVLIVVLLAVGGVGVFFAYNMLSGKPDVPTPVTTTPQPQPPAPPPAPVDTTSKVSESEIKEEATEEVVAEKPEPKVRETARVSKPTPKATTPRPAAPRRTVTPRKPAVSENKVVITSTPSGAKVTINGDYMGLTPYTWDKPIFSPLSVVVSKDGYEDDSKVFEFTGGSVRENFSLRKAAIAPPPPVYSEPEPEPPVTKYTPPPPPPAPEPVAKPEPVARPETTPTPTPVSSSFSGGEATIFIASIPPVADVFLDGKLVGKTNVSEIKLPAGTHNLKFVKGVKEVTKAITVQPGKNPSQMVRLQ